LSHVHSSLTIVAGEGILPYLPTLMQKLLLALSPSTVSPILKNINALLAIPYAHCTTLLFHFNVHQPTFD